VDGAAYLSSQQAVFSGESLNLYADPQGFVRYAAAWDALIDIPRTGIHLSSAGSRWRAAGHRRRGGGEDGATVRASVRLAGNAMRYDRGSLGLRAGKHSFHLEGLHA